MSTEAAMKFERSIIAHLPGRKLPALGTDDPDPRIVFSEAELNTIAFCIGFVRSVLTVAESPTLLPHYGKSMNSAIAKLEAKDR